VTHSQLELAFLFGPKRFLAKQASCHATEAISTENRGNLYPATEQRVTASNTPDSYGGTFEPQGRPFCGTPRSAGLPRRMHRASTRPLQARGKAILCHATEHGLTPSRAPDLYEATSSQRQGHFAPRHGARAYPVECTGPDPNEAISRLRPHRARGEAIAASNAPDLNWAFLSQRQDHFVPCHRPQPYRVECTGSQCGRFEPEASSSQRPGHCRVECTGSPLGHIEPQAWPGCAMPQTTALPRRMHRISVRPF
jgi:hypothetical protein